MFDSGFQFEFQNGRFPLRFFSLAFLITAISLIFYYNSGIDSVVLWPHLLSVLTLIVLFCGISLLLLLGMRRFIANMGIYQGMAFAGLTIVLVSVVTCLILVFANELADFGVEFVDNPHLTPNVGYVLVLLTLMLAPILLWMEKRLYSDRQALLASETEQYTNLDFRIRPHFLFNSLNSVAGLINQHPGRAETALYNLADVFRAVMADKRQLVPLKAELDLADKYLYLEKIRLGKRLKVSSKIDPNAVGVKVPIFLLQPMLENAVYHGIETRFQGGKISLIIQMKEKHLIIKITNPLPEAGVKRRVGNKVAQQNLRNRIIAIFGSRASLDSYEAETSFNVIVKLPL